MCLNNWCMYTEFLKNIVFWDVLPHLVEIYQHFGGHSASIFYPKNGCSRLLWNFGIFPFDSTASRFSEESKMFISMLTRAHHCAEWTALLPDFFNLCLYISPFLHLDDLFSVNPVLCFIEIHCMEWTHTDGYMYWLYALLASNRL